MKASVIISSYNKLSRLQATLKSYGQLDDKSCFEIIVCDDGSGYDRSDIMDNRLNMKLLSLSHQGLSATRNKGIAAAEGDIIIYSDDDLLVDHDFVTRHIRRHEENDGVAVICKHSMLHLTDSEIEFIIQNETDFKQLFMSAKKDAYAGQLTNILFQSGISRHWIRTNAGSSVKKDDLIAIGCFDEQFIGWGFEDMELGYRLSKNNIRFLYDEKLQLFHMEHSRDKKKMINDIKRNIKYFYDKHDGALEIEKYWDYLRGKITLKEFDAATYHELQENSEDDYCYLLMRNKLSEINKLDKEGE